MKPKVLVVDDEAEFVQLAEYNLSRQGYQVFTAFNGMEALHQARRILPDVIPLDLMLPEIAREFAGAIVPHQRAATAGA